MTTPSDTEHLGRLVGPWTTEATHPAMPGVIVHGTADFEWLEGEQFVVERARNDHADFPDSIAIIGVTEHDRVDPETGDLVGDTESRMTMHYFDSRGVFRVYEVRVDENALHIWRDAPGFSQRFTGSFGEGGTIIAGVWQLSRDDETWNDDLAITFRRRGPQGAP